MSTVAELFVAQMQDYLGLGEGHRMNTPGTQSGNWQWRLLPGELTPELAELAKKLDEAGNHTAYEQVCAAVSDFEKGNMRLSVVLQSLAE